MAAKWVMVRVRAETRQELEYARQRFLAGVETGQREGEIDCRNEQPGLDWTIRQLLALLGKQKARERKARAKRSQSAKVAERPIA